MRRLTLALVLLPTLAAAQTPCTGPALPVVTNPTQVALAMPAAVPVEFAITTRDGSVVGTRWSIPATGLTAAGPGCFTSLLPIGLVTVPAGVEYVATATVSGVTVASENAFVRTPPTCPTRPNEVVVGTVRVVKETVTSSTLAKRVGELELTGWSVAGFTGSATVYATCRRVP